MNRTDHTYGKINNEFKLFYNENCNQPKIKSHIKMHLIKIKDKEILISKRESECLAYLLEGLSAKETAYCLHISVRTVECHINSLLQKTDCRTKIALIGCLHKQLLNSN